MSNQITFSNGLRIMSMVPDTEAAVVEIARQLKVDLDPELYCIVHERNEEKILVWYFDQNEAEIQCGWDNSDLKKDEYFVTTFRASELTGRIKDEVEKALSERSWDITPAWVEYGISKNLIRP